ncbi:MAG: hypothetical protein ACI3YT_01740 [Prevotella sp.]
MKGKYILVSALIAVLPISMDAQKRKSNVKAKAKQTVVDKEFELRLEGMRAATQKVMFVDSIVVNKSKLLKSLNIPDESGSVMDYNTFFETTEQPNAIVYLNQLKNKCIFSKYADNGWGLYSSELIGGKWANTMPLEGLEMAGNDVDINWPFLLSDGTTLYFAAKGEESIGGYDIFMTRYDESTGEYLKPENIGMPFNSTANDYFYVVDEFDGYGWFATDRNQPEGSVCIYSFVLNNVRENYNQDNYTPEQLKQLSELHSISMTWTDEPSREQALKQLAEIAKRKHSVQKKNDFTFVINDKYTYTTLTDFKSADAAEKYARLNDIISKKAKLDNSMELAREAYPNAKPQQQEQYRKQLLAAEKQSERYDTEIAELTKKIRSIELKKLGN